MRVGIMSDSHGDAAATTAAVSLLESLGAKRLFHCGDICGEAVLDALAGHACTFVWGNCDDPAPAMRRYVARLDLTWPELPVRVELSGKRIAVYHGHERGFSEAETEPKLDYLFYGHTHCCDDHRRNGCRLINPGALYRAAVHTVALLDLNTDDLAFHDLATGRCVQPV
ncbi:MAG: metallophosphoesterase family protein [Phycisphaerae bacterium]